MTCTVSLQLPRRARRLMLSSALALQAAIVGTGLSEIALTTPQLSPARQALAQSHNLEAAENAVVYIETDQGRGSGVIIESDGLIVTNAHVVEGARQVNVTLRGRAVRAEVVAIGYSGCLDLALIKVNQSNLPVIPLSDITQVRKTQTVFAIGYPGPLPSNSATITSGIVSNLHQRDGLVQFDGPIGPGNSGGAVVSQEGKLIGIATGGIETVGGRNTNGMFFAVAVDKVQAFVNAYRSGEPALIGQNIMPGSNPDSGHLTQALALNGQTVGGVLQSGDSAVCGDSTLADIYTFAAEAGQGVMIDLSSPDMGVELVLVSPSGQVLGQSRSQGRNQAAIVLEKLPEHGTYSVVAKASQSNRDGRYQLRATEPVLVERGALDRSTRPCFEGGQRCQDFQFQGRANQTVTVALRQAEFDPYLVLLDASGNVIARGQTDRNALVNFTLPEDGWYTLVVSSLRPEDIGQFIVSIHDTETLITSKENVQ